jgi:hypothetical protein
VLGIAGVALSRFGSEVMFWQFAGVVVGFGVFA